MNTEVLLVAVIAALPGLLGIGFSIRVRKDTNRNQVTDFGTALADTAFKTMEGQVKRLTIDQHKWDVERELWDADRDRLLTRVAALTGEVRITNAYLQILLATLDTNNISHPSPPFGWMANRVDDV